MSFHILDQCPQKTCNTKETNWAQGNMNIRKSEPSPEGVCIAILKIK